MPQLYLEILCMKKHFYLFLNATTPLNEDCRHVRATVYTFLIVNLEGAAEIAILNSNDIIFFLDNNFS